MKSRFSSVVLIVSNLQASVKFYRLMGLHINYEGEDVNHVDCMQEGGCMVTLVPEVTVKKHRVGWSASVGNRIALQFNCANQNDVDVLYTKMINEGYQNSVQPYATPWGERYAQLLDPDGNTVAIFSVLDLPMF